MRKQVEIGVVDEFGDVSRGQLRGVALIGDDVHVFNGGDGGLLCFPPTLECDSNPFAHPDHLTDWAGNEEE